MLTRRANAAREHQIELLRLPNFVVGIRVVNGVFATQFAKLWAGKIVELGPVRNLGHAHSKMDAHHCQRSLVLLHERVIELHSSTLDCFLLFLLFILLNRQGRQAASFFIPGQTGL